MNTRSSKGKGIDLDVIEFSADDSTLLGWDPDLAFGDGIGSSEVPLPEFDDFFVGLPSSFDTPPTLDELARSKVVAGGSRMINGVSFPILKDLCLVKSYIVSNALVVVEGTERAQLGPWGEQSGGNDLLL